MRVAYLKPWLEFMSVRYCATVTAELLFSHAGEDGIYSESMPAKAQMLAENPNYVRRFIFENEIGCVYPSPRCMFGNCLEFTVQYIWATIFEKECVYKRIIGTFPPEVLPEPKISKRKLERTPTLIPMFEIFQQKISYIRNLNAHGFNPQQRIIPGDAYLWKTLNPNLKKKMFLSNL